MKPGWIVEKIRGKPVGDLSPRRRRPMRNRGSCRSGNAALIRRLEAAGSTVGVDFLDNHDQPSTST